jgi:hypothetical protein
MSAKAQASPGVQEGAEMGGNAMQKSAAAIDQWPCLFLSSPEGGAGGDCGKGARAQASPGRPGRGRNGR